MNRNECVNGGAGQARGGAIKSHVCASEFTGERPPAAMVALLFFPFTPFDKGDRGILK
jgi:hypothetical protein